MSEALILTGKRGQGKSLYAISKIREYLLSGRIVATNMNLYMDKLVPPTNKTRAFRIADFPRVEDFKMLPLGNPNPKDEEKNGLLVLDEGAAFLNARSWNEDAKGRLAVIAWLAQSRKFGWDLILIAQHQRMIDAQLRDSLFELFGQAIRLDKMMIPFVSRFFKGLGIKVRMPKLHRVNVRIGADPRAPLADSSFFSGADLWDGYDTLQKIDPLIGVPTGCGYTVLSHWDIHGRYMSKWQIMRKAFILTSIACFLVGIGISEIRHALKPINTSPAAVVKSEEKAPKYSELGVRGHFESAGRTSVILSDGQTRYAKSVKQLADGSYEFELDDFWVKERK